mmetsp:Transcript_1815/g.4887  ORF Transcript_1815/g.4887 Transcript_1815/m.4887 type:complete len:435 (-) Transcript_1815:83-1387(-)
MNSDSKTLLGQFLQRSIGRTLKKDDVIYTTVEDGGRFQSTVRLACKQGEEYVGEPGATDKEAMQGAAGEALKDFAAEIAALPPKEPKRKGKATEGGEGKGKGQGKGKGKAAAKAKAKAKAKIAGRPNPKAARAAKTAASQGPNSKLELAMHLQAQFKKAMTKEDVVYEAVQLDEGFQASVKLVITGGQEFTGEVCAGQKLAEASAAQQALMNSHMWSDGTPVAPKVGGKQKKVLAPQPKKKQQPQKVKLRTVKPQAILRHQQMPGPKPPMAVGPVPQRLKLQTLRAQTVQQQPKALGLKQPKVPAPKQPMVAGATKRKAPGQASPDMSANPKSELAFFLQGHLGRAMTKSDVVYASQAAGGGFQATIDLACCQNRQYAGEVCETGKLAEASAASQALLAVSAEMGQPAPGKKKQRLASAAGQQPARGKGQGKAR